MVSKADAPSTSVHDESLLDWFLSLDPTQRLAELESRIAFFNSVAPDDEPEFSANSGNEVMIGPTWVFGYGSLIWRQDFPYLDARRAHIPGWTRRFWQGSHDHRGVASDPGRVVTLVEAPGDPCYGRAFLVEPEVFEHLDHREKNGYVRHGVDIFFDEGQTSGVVYIASTANFAFLGPAPPEEIAAQINRCAGPSGTNADYVLELARALKGLEISDPHVFEVEALVLETQSS